jgi:hypothetical protein
MCNVWHTTSKQASAYSFCAKEKASNKMVKYATKGSTLFFMHACTYEPKA